MEKYWIKIIINPLLHFELFSEWDKFDLRIVVLKCVHFYLF